MTDRVVELATKEFLNTHQIVERLVEDPDVKDRLNKLGGNVKLMATDVYRALLGDLKQKTAILGESVGSEAETSLVVQGAKERALSIIQTGEEYDAIAKRCLALMAVELDAYEEVKSCGDEDKARLARFPAAMLDTTRKMVMADLQFLRAMKSDPQVQGLIRAQTVNISQGITSERLHEILFAVGDVLGKDRTAMMTAYTKALVAEKRNKHRREAVVDAPAIPPFAQALEKSLGLSPDEGATPA